MSFRSLLLLQGVNILPTVIQLQSNARANAFEQPTATPDSDLPGELLCCMCAVVGSPSESCLSPCQLRGCPH